MIVSKSAVISEDNKYRYHLARTWDDSGKRVLFIMLNPSTADDMTDDPTIRRICGYAKEWGYGGLDVGNIYAYRSTNPKTLKTTQDPHGPENKQHLRRLIQKADIVVYAWGTNVKQEPEWLRQMVPVAYCIDVSKHGIPRHPLYLRKDLKPRIFRQQSK